MGLHIVEQLQHSFKNKGVAIGEEKHAKRYRQIPTDIFDSEHDLQCHSEICRLRDQLIAHSDIGFKNPEFLSRDAIGTNLAISNEDWEKLAENLRRLTKTAFNHLAEIITGHRRPSSGGEPEKPDMNRMRELELLRKGLI